MTDPVPRTPPSHKNRTSTSSPPLATSSSSSTSATPARVKSSDDLPEVNYRTNPTPLFLSVEECDWNAAITHCHQNPTHVRTWVISTGTEQTLFNWSVWRRLPIHEACRRQPPMSVIQTLLLIYPEAAYCKSQFGELPLHLAAGCGASSEVVYMLLSFNPWGVILRDNGGRTPLEIVRSGGKLREDSHLIEEALERCEKAVHDKNDELDEKLNKVKNEHKKEVRKMKMKSDEQLQMKEDTINNLRKRLERSKSQIDELVETMKECESRIMDKNDAETHLMDRVFHLEKENGRIRADNHKLKNMVLLNEQKAEEKQEKIEELSKVMQTLLIEVNAMVDERERNQAKAKKLERDTLSLLDGQRRYMFDVEKEKEYLLTSARHAAKSIDRLMDNTENERLERAFEATGPTVSPLQTPISNSRSNISNTTTSTKSGGNLASNRNLTPPPSPSGRSFVTPNDDQNNVAAGG